MDTTLTHVSSPWAPGKDQAARDPGEIPNYDLLGFIKAGGFGDVWLVCERVTGVRRALKVVYKSEVERAARDIEGVRRYQRCAHNHPHLLQILTVGETARCFYYVMEAADNATDQPGEYAPTTLRTLMDRTGRFEARAALALIDKLLSGVIRLHEQGLAHRDLKPENILIVEGVPRIADVGLVAPANAPPSRSGTRFYMTPQGRADDLYALGKILYELISGCMVAEYPELRPELLDGATAELAGAVQTSNRASHRDPARRFGSAMEFRAQIATQLRRPRRIRAGWRRLSRRRRLAVSAAILLSCGLMIAGGAWLRARVVPVRTYERYEAFAAQESLSFAAPPTREGVVSPFLYVAEAPLPRPGRYAWKLGEPIENFVVDAHLRVIRPGDQFVIVCAESPTNGPGLWVRLRAQPAGLGLRTMLAIRDNATGRLRGEEKTILGHPQPGIEYVLRVARCREAFSLHLWPLSSGAAEPASMTLKLPRTPLVLKAIAVEADGPDSRSRVDLLSLRARGYSIPLEDAAAELPELVEAGPRPAWVPALPDDPVTPMGNLLAGDSHPYFSNAWMSIGNWSWFRFHGLSGVPREISCVPFSEDERKDLAKPVDVYDGVQMLRFDRGAYGDFEARLHVRLRDPNDADTEIGDPFPTRSHSGSVGLAFRLQDVSPPGGTWGGGYIAEVSLHPKAHVPVRALIKKATGYALGSGQNHFQVSTWLPDDSLEVAVEDVCERERLFRPDGFTLTVRAEGRKLAMFLDDQPVPLVALTDPDPDYYRAGRIALYASRLIATFESLEVTPLPAE